MARALTTRPVMDLWLDDCREPVTEHPLTDPIFWVTTAEAAIEALRTIPIRWASLDHDLGITKTRDGNGHTGRTVVLWMAEHDVWPIEGIIVHSYNPEGAKWMCGTIDRYAPYRAIRRLA